LGQGLNVVESSASLVSDFADSSRRMAALRQRMMRVYDQQLAVGRALDTARMDLQVARSAYQANEAAIQQLKAQFPQRFARLSRSIHHELRARSDRPALVPPSADR
jgi:hypothetical protein